MCPVYLLPMLSVQAVTYVPGSDHREEVLNTGDVDFGSWMFSRLPGLPASDPRVEDIPLVQVAPHPTADEEGVAARLSPPPWIESVE